MSMCDDAGGETSSSAEVSDVGDENSSFNVTENDELYDKADSSGLETTDSYSAELAESPNSENDSELYDEPLAEDEELEFNEASDTTDDSVHIESGTDIEDNNSSSLNDSETETDRTEINETSEYSDEVNDWISSKEELEVYQKADLREETIDGRTCLVRDDIDMDYVDPKSGMTNRELMEKGRSPYDSKTGERIELHHIGQEYDSPLAELTADSEHGQYYSALHTKESESWRSDELKCNRYNNVDRPQHWAARAKGCTK